MNQDTKFKTDLANVVQAYGMTAHTAEAKATLISSLATSLAIAITISCDGDKEQIDKVVYGVESFLMASITEMTNDFKMVKK
jgi:hypothetical protein